MERWLSVRQRDALPDGQTMLTNGFYFLILLISYENHCTALKFTLNLTNP